MAKRKKKSAARIVLSVLCVLMGIVLAVLVGGTVFVNSMLNRINRVQPVPETLSNEDVEWILSETDPVAEEDYTGQVLRPEDVTMPTAPAEIIEDEEHIVNILLIGQDRRANQGRQRSDAMILCTINTEKKTLVMTSFLRDLYVQLPDYNGRQYYKNRINATYAIGGMEMLDDCLELNFGVKVDYNIEVDFSGFEDIIDLIGGVDIELTQSEADWIGKGTVAGMNRLDGERALTYSRIRKLDSDFGRTNRQRKVLAAILQRVKNLSLSEITELANNIFPMITTDMTNGDIVKYVLEFFPLLTDLQVTTQHIPYGDNYYGAMIDGMSVLVPDLEANIQILKDTIG